MLPKLTTLSPNFHLVETSKMLMWFSYETLIAFQPEGKGRCVRQNEWGPTTGKHINTVSRDAVRLPGPLFEEKFKEFA